MKPLQSPPAHHWDANTTRVHKAPMNNNYGKIERCSRGVDPLGWYVEAKCT